MSAEILALSDYRKPRQLICRCGVPENFVCYPHRLTDLAARVDDVRADVEQFQFCDWSTFERLTNDVLDVIQGITDECMSSAREGLE